MISRDFFKKLATLYHTSEYPNVVREYCQHLLLSELYKLKGAENLLFKGGTALRILYGSPRFSEDLDFSLLEVKSHHCKTWIENLLTQCLASIEQIGIHMELGAKPGPTSDGYYGEVVFRFPDYSPLLISLNISLRNGTGKHSEIDSVANDFVPIYNIVHLSQKKLVEEKIFGALLERKKPRDFYDLYFIMRKGMLTPFQKKRLVGFKNVILSVAKTMNFKHELSVFLPIHQQNIIRDFNKILVQELERQLA